LLYGPEVVGRLNCLSLHQDDCRLSGLLIQLALDERVAMLVGCDFLRLCNVRLMDRINSCHITHEGLASTFINDQAIDLQTCMVSLECVYGVSLSGDFKNLVTALLRDGAPFEDAVPGVLHGEYGNPYSWVEVYLQKEAEYRTNRGPLFENLRLDSTVSDDESDVDR
jgi:hypothetical protein